MADDLRFLRGAGGTRLAVRAAGDPQAPPVVFVHGWGSAAEAWSAQLGDLDLAAAHRLIAVDLRGHGQSETPAAGYGDPATWADDIAAVLAYAGRPAVVVGWSYGGLVLTDYLRERGTAGVAGLVLVGALTEIGKGRPGGATGSAWAGLMRSVLAEDPDEAIPAVTTFVDRMTAESRTGTEIQRGVSHILRVPPAVRKALFARDIGSADVLTSIDVPTLIAHGTADTVVAPSCAEYAAGKISGAVPRWFENVGHMPFTERRAEFNTALLEFTGSIANH